MPTSGSATGGNDVFNGKNRVYWWLLSQDYLAGAHGQSTVRWAWNVNWAAGDNCHTINSGQVIFSGNGVYFASSVHAFSGAHVHSGDWPPADINGGGFSTGTVVVDHDASGVGLVRVQGSHVGTSGPTSSSDTGVQNLPDIPQTVASPSAASVARVSDTQQTVSWTNNSTATAPYANIKVYRSTDGGAYALIATLGVVTSYSDTTTSANHKYTYRVSAVGSNTVEVGYATTSAIWTTPGTPTSLVAAKIAGGNIRLTWTNNVNYPEYTVRIEESQNGGAYTEITSVASGTTTWDHVAPSSSVTHKYRIRARTSSGTTLNSSYSNESATITLLATANAPTGLAPSGVTLDATEVIVFTWTHNPADGTPQSKYQLQYKIGAGSFVTVGPTTSGVSSYSMPASTVTNGQTITWHVATAGENGTIGPYSSDAIFTTQNRPTSTVSVPGSSWTNSHLTASWTYFQAQGSAQASWHAYLWKKGALGDYSDATLIEEAAGSGTASSYSFAATLLDQTVYAVRVYVTSAAGLTSIDSGTPRQEFTVTYLPPADATLSAVYDANFGRMVVTVNGTISIPSIQGLVLDGTGDWGSTTDKAALDITGDIDISADIMPTDWTPTGGWGIAEKWLTASNLSYAFVLVSTGFLRLRITTSGLIGTLAEATSSVAVGVTDGSRLSVRVARVGTTVTFYTSTDTNLSTATWTQLGTTQTLSGTIFSGTSALTIGSNGPGNAFTGTIFSVLVKGASGTTVAYPNYTTQAAGTTSFSDGFSNTWTLVGNANIATVIPGTVDISTVDLQRRIGTTGDWVTWVTGIVLTGVPGTANVTDTMPTIKGTNYYRAIIRSATPSSKLSPEINVVTTERQWGFLTTGPGFADLVRMRARLSNQSQTGRAKDVYHFAGREDPVELSGEEVVRSFAVNATLYPTSMGGMSSEPEELEELAVTTGVVLWRDYTGRRIFASISPVQVNYETEGNKFPVSFNLRKVDYDENVG